MTVDERRGRVQDLYAGAGMTIPEVARELGFAVSTIGRDVKALGISRPMGPAPKYPPPPTDLVCEGCGGPIRFSSPSAVKRHRGRFCSQKCFLAWAKTGELARCLQCGTERYWPRCRLERGAQAPFCSQSCWNQWRWQHRGETMRNFITSGVWGGRGRSVWLGRHGGRAKGGGDGRPLGYSADQVEKVRQLRAKTLSLRVIARLTGLSKDQVARIVAAEEVSQNPLG
jgi:hypothetical protein